MTSVEYDTNFYVGPIGALRALPNTSDKVDASLATIGGTHTSLTGAFTRDTFGFQRSWVWNYALVTDRQALYLEALARKLVPGPLYLIDPRRPNRLPEQIASGGSQLGSTVGFIPSNSGSCLWRPLSGAPATPSTLPMSPILRGCLEWQLLAAGGGGLELAGFAGAGRHDVPVLPNEQLEVSMWVTGPPAASLAGQVTVYDTAGNPALTTALPSTSPSLTTWQRVSVTLTCPSNAARLRLVITADPSSPAGSIYLTGLQVARYGATYVPGLQQLCDDPDFGGWWLGGGAPQVVAGAASTSYAYPGLQAGGLALTERSFAGTIATQLPQFSDTTGGSGGGTTTTVAPVKATRWAGGVLDGTTGATDSWQSTTPTIDTNMTAFVSKRALHIVEPADGSSTPGTGAGAPAAGDNYQRCEQYIDLSGVLGVDANGDFGPGFTGYFGLSVFLDSDFPINPRETGGGAAWQLISQWKNDGTGSPPCELSITNGYLNLNGNNSGWTINICPVNVATRYDIICGMTFTESAATSSANVWVNSTKYVTNGQPVGQGFLYPGVRSYWKAGLYRESGSGVVANQARASIWYGALCFDTDRTTVATYLSNT